MIATLILVTNDHFVLPFSAIEMQLRNVLILIDNFNFLIISAYLHGMYGDKKSSLQFTN